MNKLDFLTQYAVENTHYNLNQVLDEMVNSNDTVVRRGVARHPNLTIEQINTLINDFRWSVRHQIAQHPFLTEQQINKLLQDENPHIREQALKHPKCKTL